MSGTRDCSVRKALRFGATLLVASLAPGGFCQQQVSCSGSATTSISGTVFAPNGVDPLPNVFIYIPSEPLTAFKPGVSCGDAAEQISGAPLVSALSATNGSFTLTDVPAGANIPLVIQVGRWRRQVTIPNVPACKNTVLPASLTHLPASKTEGDIPKIALVTGAVDGLECLLRKIGIADSEFTNASGTGRINLFKGSGAPGALIDQSTPAESELESSQKSLDSYDMLMFPCQGTGQLQPSADTQALLIKYANSGGRVFATHSAYVWLYNDAPFSGAADWEVGQQAEFTADPETANVVETISGSGVAFPAGERLAQWLKDVGASTTLGQLPLGTLRKDQDGVASTSQAWLTITDQHYTTPTVMQFSFDTPLGQAPAQLCGRVMFNEYHVEDQSLTTQTLFPAECSAGKMTAQEKLLEFSLFNLSEFITAGEPPDLTVGVTSQPAKFHQGDSGDSIAIGVANAGSTAAATASLAVKIALPPGLVVKSLKGAGAGTGWICKAATLTCSRSTELKTGASDPIALVVSVTANAPVAVAAPITATATGGGLLNAVIGAEVVTIAGHPIVTWASPAAITYGTPLGKRQLDAATTVPGKFVYAPAAGKVLAAGTQTLSVTFTPSDKADFATVTAKVSLHVNPALLTATAKNVTVAFNKPLPKLTYTVAGLVNHETSAVLQGSAVETTTAKQGSPVGTYPIKLAIGTLKAPNYKFTLKNGVLTITPP